MLLYVARSAQRAEVRPIKPARLVNADRDDVVYLAGCCDGAAMFAVLAQRILSQVARAEAAPLPIVATAARCALAG